LEARNGLRAVVDQMAERPVAQPQHQIAHMRRRLGVQLAEHAFDKVLVFIGLFRLCAVADETVRHEAILSWMIVAPMPRDASRPGKDSVCAKNNLRRVAALSGAKCRETGPGFRSAQSGPPAPIRSAARAARNIPSRRSTLRPATSPLAPPALETT